MPLLQQALTGIEQPSAPATPEPADSAEALSHTVAQVSRHTVRLQGGYRYAENRRVEIAAVGSSCPLAVRYCRWAATLTSSVHMGL